MTTNLPFEDYDKLLVQIRKTEYCTELKLEDIKLIGYKFNLGKVWEITTELTLHGKIEVVSIYVNFPSDFPLSLPKFFLEEKFYHSTKYIPHINHEKVICVYDAGLNLKVRKETLGELLEYFIHRAKDVIQKGINDPESSDIEFKREFKAYWEGTYSKNDRVLNIGLHAIPDELNKSQVINGLRFHYKFQSQYFYFISNDEFSLESIKDYSRNNNISFTEIDVIYINNPFVKPPFDISYKESFEFLKRETEIYPDFNRLAKKVGWKDMLVIFSSNFSSNTEYFGWSYRNIILPKGFREKSQRDWVNNSVVGKQNKIDRIIFENISGNRLQRRTSGYIETQKSIAITGLGSVGSNLVYFLKNLPVEQFNLIDNELLSIENIKRHLLGFSEVNFPKVKVVEKYLLDFLPLLKTNVKAESITEVLLKEPNFINECDYHFVALGNSNLEQFILENIKGGRLTKPTFFFWVEPYLASGQMLFILPEDASLAIDHINNFPNHVIDTTKKQLSKIYMIEGGCQSGYFPYSSSYLIQFLSVIFPELKKLVIDSSQNSLVFSWIGDKSLLESKGIMISDFGNQNESFKLLKSALR